MFQEKIRMKIRRSKFLSVGIVVCALLVPACGGNGESDGTPEAAGESADATAAEPTEDERIADAPSGDDECAPPEELPEELPVPPCDRTVGSVVRTGDQVTWIMVSNLPSDEEVKAFLDDGFASADWQVEYLEGPYEGAYVLQISGHGIETGKLRFGSNNVTEPTIRYELTLE